LTLWIDDREPAKVINQLRQLVKDVELRRMDTGDYVVGNFAMERKTVEDLLGSVYDGRLWKQLGHLKDTYPHTCVIIEGDINLGSRRSNGELWGEGDIRLFTSVCNSIIMGWSIPIVYTSSYVATAQQITEFYKRSEKRGDKPRSVVKKQVDPKVAQQSMLQVIDGVGAIASARLLTNFTFRELVNVSDPSVLCKRTVGLNKKQAETIVKVFNCE
jgi:DNA excision repair protein ERCC-4